MGDYVVECPICGKLVPAVRINAHIDANCPAPGIPATVAGEKKESHNTDKMDVSKKDSPAPPQRMAPLFAPKVAPPAAHNKPSTFGSSGQKRTIESTSSFNTTTAPKKKKMDAAAESMPLAAKGIYIESY